MKVYPISKGMFWAVFILILVLPVSRHWYILAAGRRTVGTVQAYEPMHEVDRMGHHTTRWSSRIHYRVGDSIYVCYGPENKKLEAGKTIPLIYNAKHPSRYAILTFSGFYLNYYTILPVVLLALWTAFYTSFRKRVRP